MSDFKEIIRISSAIEGSKITGFFRTSKKTHSIPQEDGAGELKWYKLIVKLDNGDAYQLDVDNIQIWDSQEELVEVKPDSFEMAKNILIESLTYNEETGEIYIKLENNYLILHQTFFGSEFEIDTYDAFFG